jgi:hypothetical protein
MSKGLRMAKATKNDLHDMFLANHILEVCFDKWSYSDINELTFEDFEHLVDDEDHPKDRTYIKNMFEDGKLSESKVLEAVNGLFAAGSHGRVVMGCEILIDNCCDPEIDHLEFKPLLKYSDELLECCQDWLKIKQNNEDTLELTKRTMKAIGIIKGTVKDEEDD